MKLSEYIPSKESGAAIAKKIGVADSLVSQWRTGVRPIPAERCPSIERATAGAVTCEEMRPDVDWAVLRRRVRKAA